MQVPGSVEWRGEGGMVVVIFGNWAEEGGCGCNACMNRGGEGVAVSSPSLPHNLGLFDSLFEDNLVVVVVSE